MVKISALFAVAATVAASAKISVQVHRNLEVAKTSNVVVKFHCGQALTNHRRRLKAGASRTETIESLVQSLKEHTDQSQASVKNLLSTEVAATSNKVKVTTTWIDCSMYIDNASDDLVKKIASLPEVKSINEPVVIKLEQPKKSDQPAVVAGANQWGVDMINAPALWATGTKGDGIVVANIDTGVRYTHEALKSNWRKEYGWYDPYNNTDMPVDPWGHGTHTMGTMVGTTQGMGVAPNAKWMACVGCPENMCPGNILTQCAQFLLCPHDKDGKNPDCSKAPHVINNSWGAYSTYFWWEDTIAAWRAAGIIPVFSNGNNGYDGCGTVGYPGSSPQVIGVGATDSTDHLAYFSSLGPAVTYRIKPDISAPGDWVTSAGNYDDTGLSTMSGTSMAAPHISGSIALYLSAHKNATYDQVYTALTNNVDTDTLIPPNKRCDSIPNTEYPNNLFGFGRVNAFRAVTAPPSTPRPTRPPTPPKCSSWTLDYDYVGGDIKSVSSRDFDDCCDECDKTPLCNAYTFTWDNSGTCWLKTIDDSTPWAYKVGARSAKLVNPTKPPTKCGTLENNTDYLGNDLTSTKQTQPDACCADCENTPRCKLFVWSNYLGGTCWLKHTKGTKVVSNGAIAGQLPTSATCTPIEDNVDYFGNDIKSTSRASADACCADCDNTAGCKLFVWSNYNGGTCWLKHTQGVKSTVMGARAAKLVASPTCAAPETNVDFVAQDIAEAPGAQAADCCAACHANQACNAYSWFNGMCYLKGRRASTISKTGVVSARVDKCSPLEVDVDYVNNDLSNVSADVADCCAICRQTSGCRAFSWLNGVCYLKSGKGATISKPGVQSATVN
ncbi:hypothetical protein H310_03300 [Aphanomyces invadans]|uniref:subtilisin n=1 Tax=Aphanomyces invadans TaxID=157072 RepID=A0A024UH78_9STRA|nr:hypothetical protein H310_03300 [Aphanomyces invadans]ETW05550.1 hypothetical protein H310_03300 [Aphanomyces invadans]|eukprot:XP_008865327.1 hypothetical protein H310_03300 [Aphanomyces invadans]